MHASYSRFLLDPAPLVSMRTSEQVVTSLACMVQVLLSQDVSGRKRRRTSFALCEGPKFRVKMLPKANCNRILMAVVEISTKIHQVRACWGIKTTYHEMAGSISTKSTIGHLTATATATDNAVVREAALPAK